MPTYHFEFDRIETITAALALRAHATEAYCDERLTTASSVYALAARFFVAAGYDAKANVCRQLSLAITNEAIAIAAGDEAEAGYVAGTIKEMQRS
jgi:hypothetical protein